MTPLRALPLVVLVLAACATEPVDDLPIDPDDASFLDDDGKADGGCGIAGDDDARGLLALANDDTVDADALHAAGLAWRTAHAIVERRPHADLAALDAVPTVGPVACRVLGADACDVRGLCEPTLGLWTWNVEHFPLRDGTVARVADVLEGHDVELVGFEEVDSLPAWDELLGALPGWAGLPGQTGFDTRVAIAYRTDRLRLLAVEDLFVDDSWRFPRPPLAATFEVTGRAGARSLTVVVVHLKAMVDATSQGRRREAIVELERWTAARRATGEDVILVGDWNDDIDDRPEDDVFQPFTAAPDAYATPTRAIADRGGYSYLPFRRLIDHLVFTQEAAAHFTPTATDVIHLELEVEDYQEQVSDHLPVGTTLIPILPAR